MYFFLLLPCIYLWHVCMHMCEHIGATHTCGPHKTMTSFGSLFTVCFWRRHQAGPLAPLSPKSSVWPSLQISSYQAHLVMKISYLI